MRQNPSKRACPDAAKLPTPTLRKANLQVDLDMLAKIAADGEPQDTVGKRQAALLDVQELIDDTDSLRTLKQQYLVATGIKLVEGDACPLCDLAWNCEVLLQHLNAKLDSAQQTTAFLNTLNENINHVVAERKAFNSALTRLVDACAKMTPAVEAHFIKIYATQIESGTETLRSFVAQPDDLSATKEALEQELWVLPEDAKIQIDAYAAGVAALPEVSAEDQARDFLTRTEDQYGRKLNAFAAFDEAASRTTKAGKVREIFETNSDIILEALYNDVADNFTEFYRSLNPEDEGGFVGNLIPSAAKLGFNVDFYGRGKFPPGAYHSEGHQDGMGLCLYLALMKRTLGDKFTFSVLDDVLMSVDADHRREVCKLLRREFPDTQFIITTHDRVWLKFMHTENLINNSQTFSTWSVEAGPKVWHTQEVWDEIEDELSRNNIETAAAKLRHYLEYVANLQADSLQARVRLQGGRPTYARRSYVAGDQPLAEKSLRCG